MGRIKNTEVKEGSQMDSSWQNKKQCRVVLLLLNFIQVSRGFCTKNQLRARMVRSIYPSQKGALLSENINFFGSNYFSHIN